MFWHTFKRLCLEADKTTTEAAKGMGIQYDTLKRWRRGAMPQERTLERIAEYFHVPISDIMLELDKDLPSEPSEFPLTKLEFRIIRAVRCLSPEQQEFCVEALESAVRRLQIKGAVPETKDAPDK